MPSFGDVVSVRHAVPSYMSADQNPSIGNSNRKAIAREESRVRTLLNTGHVALEVFIGSRSIWRSDRFIMMEVPA